MRLLSSRWLLVAGLLAALGGCRQPEKKCCCTPISNERLKPVPEPAVMPLGRPQSLPAIPSEAVAPVSAPPNRVAEQPASKPARPLAQPVEYKTIAKPNLAHAPDHSWLIGRLEQDETNHRWYVRYANPGDKEQLGGRLELLGTGPMASFRVGQIVRVEGKLVDPAPFQTQPAYQIRSLQAIPQG